MKIFIAQISLLVLLLLEGNLIPVANSAKIFFMIPLTTKSEKQPYIPFIDALANRGHEVTVASIIKSSYTNPNITEFVPSNYETLLGDAFSDPIEVRRTTGKYFSLYLDYEFAYQECHRVYNHPEFQKAINQKYDLVIANHLFSDCLLGVLHKLQVPYISFCSMLPYHYLWEVTGTTLPASFVPLAMGPKRPTGKLSFYDRLENTLLILHHQWITRFQYHPDAEKVYRKYLGQDVPSANEISKNFSLIFSNTHYTYNAPAPAMPDIIEVGGMHCRPAKPLPKELNEFLSGGKDGFILFSMGSILKSKYFSEPLRLAFLNAFSKLKQRVLWKFEEDMENLPPNVKIMKWIPQQDILGHPNIRLFMTHGGAMSLFEAIYHGVPLITLPVFVDQDINANLAVQRGIGHMLEVLELTEESISAAINEVLTNPSYKNKAKEMSSAFRDQPQTPVERAVFWTEYVLRHNGTSLMRSSARDLNFVEYHLLDVIALLAFTVIGILASAFLLLRFLTRSLFSEKKSTEKIKRKTQ